MGDQKPAVVLPNFNVIAVPGQAGEGAHPVGKGADDRPVIGTSEPHLGGEVGRVLEGRLGAEVQQDIIIVAVDSDAEVLAIGAAGSQQQKQCQGQENFLVDTVHRRGFFLPPIAGWWGTLPFGLKKYFAPLMNTMGECGLLDAISGVARKARAGAADSTSAMG